ncbi:MAG TPA: membrane protein insertase YidC [Caldimonas sp.]|nr:membrane protein insertase YidC [Caldimonas sp.]HEV7575382.1 membrane protein insertase YidC [Caldimonas sp.]
MTDIRRTLLWGIFLASLFFIWESWNRHNGQPSMFGPPPAARIAAPAAPAPSPAATPVPGSGLPGAAAAAATSPVAAAPAASAPAANQQVTISTDLVRATLDSTGGTLARVELLKQVDPFDHSKNVVLLDRSPSRLYLAESGLVPPAGGAGLPNHHTPMHLLPGERTLGAGQNELKVAFESDPVGGVKLIKTYTFRRGDYVIDVQHQIVNASPAPINPRLYLQLVRDGNSPPGESSLYFTFTGPAIYTDSAHYKKIDFKSIEKRGPGDKPDHETSGTTGWVAMVQHYFASAWLADKPGAPAPPREFFTAKIDTNTYSVGELLPLGEIAPGATKTFDARLFVGPQEEDKLAQLAPGLELVKDYGWFTILAKPLFWLLTQLHKLIGNWGWSIVGLVVLLKIAFYWLNAKAYGSMAKMKAINPRIMEMRERLKDKPQQMQQEMMRIYREEKVNPLGGCLPIFVQMPFFIALYWVLLSTVEMRNAPWIGWITDLSAKDPFFILPVLMTLTSLLQTWLNPTPPDPVQARMMWIMPLVFSVMFFFFPAGLVLYWLTNNVLSIAQQYLINKRLGVLGK